MKTNMENNNYNYNFWKERSKKYDELEWVKNQKYLESFLQAGEFKKDDHVLDAGTGTGTIACSVSPLVKKVVGLDKSLDMLKHTHRRDNIDFVEGNILNIPFEENTFDKITARMVWHHLFNSTQEATNECYRVLKPGGKMVLSEGVPPVKEVKEDYMKIFELKEKRLTFFEEDLEELMNKAGFKNVQRHITVLEDMSLRNWLGKSGLPQETQDKIFDYHINASDFFKKVYNLKQIGDDCLINWKMVTIVGEK